MEQSCMDDFISNFITVGKLREMLSELDDDELITVTSGNSQPNHKILCVDDSTSFGFWELRIKE